jgi:type VI secretion system protein ImpG
MEESLLDYYERELTTFRQLGQEFAQAYPKVASRLLLEPGKCEDPHVERLIQAVAFLAARIHRKLDDQFPEITDALLGLLYPHYLAPIPSMSVAEFMIDPEQGKLTSGYEIARGTQLYSRPIDGTQCRFRTCYPLTLWPIEVRAARFDVPERAMAGSPARGLLRLELQCKGGVSFQDLQIERLRFYLDGEGQLVHTLYELLLNHVHEVRLRPTASKAARKPIVLTGSCLQPVGFSQDEGLLPYPAHALLGYRLLQEYFAFPQKFLFVDLTGLDAMAQSGFTDTLEVLIFLDRPPREEQSIGPENFRLGCTPIVNLFTQVAEPIRLDHTQHEYRIIPDVRRQQANEVYGINEVVLTTPQSDEVHPVHPIYSVRHSGTDDKPMAYWYSHRKPSEKKGDSGTELYVSLVDLCLDPALPAAETLTVSITCSNRGLAAKLSADDVRGDFELEGAAPVSRIRALVKPTNPIPPPLTGARQWQLISQLSLNYLSIGLGGPEALREILRLYDFSDSAVARQHISGIINVSSRRVVRRPSAMGWHGFCRGTEVTVEFDEDKYVGSGVFLFASVLEQFLGLYTTINSFTQFVAKSRQRERPIKQWPPKAGEQVLL